MVQFATFSNHLCCSCLIVPCFQIWSSVFQCRPIHCQDGWGLLSVTTVDGQKPVGVDCKRGRNSRVVNTGHCCLELCWISASTTEFLVLRLRDSVTANLCSHPLMVSAALCFETPRHKFWVYAKTVVPVWWQFGAKYCKSARYIKKKNTKV